MPPASLSHVGRDEAGTDDGQQQRDPRVSSFRENVIGTVARRCLSIVITSSAVMMPESRPCSSTTASVSRLYLSKSAATSSSGVSGAQLTGGSLSSRSGVVGGEIAIFTRGTAPTSLTQTLVQVDRRQGLATASNPFRVSIASLTAPTSDSAMYSVDPAGGRVFAELEELADFLPFRGLQQDQRNQ